MSLYLKSESITKAKIYIRDREKKNRIRKRELLESVRSSEYQAFF